MLVRLVKEPIEKEVYKIDEKVDINVTAAAVASDIPAILKIDMKRYFYTKLTNKMDKKYPDVQKMFGIINRCIDNIKDELLLRSRLLVVQDLYFQLYSAGIIINTTEVLDLLDSKVDTIIIKNDPKTFNNSFNGIKN